jgi:hypothetical protein
MPKIKYVSKKFSSSSLEIITQANQIIEDYAELGFDLTLRQLYYQFVSRDLIPNSDTEYKRLGAIINNARLAGLVNWESITDRTRNLEQNTHWNNPGEIIRAAAQQFRQDLWKDQAYHVEVWIEKDALKGIIQGICAELDVPYFSCRGYTSQSEMWSAAQRLTEKEDELKRTVVIHLGDHDPSGKDMTRDIQERLELFGARTVVERIVLNKDQIDAYNPPPNPAKITDSRAKGYIKEFGRSSWELDALEPTVLVNLVRDTVESYLDKPAFERAKDAVTAHKKILEKVAKSWHKL